MSKHRGRKNKRKELGKANGLISSLEKMHFEAVLYLSLLEPWDMTDTPLYRNSTFLKNGSQNLIDELRTAQGLSAEQREEFSRIVGASVEQKKAFELLHTELTTRLRGIVYG